MGTQSEQSNNFKLFFKNLILDGGIKNTILSKYLEYFIGLLISLEIELREVFLSLELSNSIKLIMTLFAIQFLIKVSPTPSILGVSHFSTKY